MLPVHHLDMNFYNAPCCRIIEDGLRNILNDSPWTPFNKSELILLIRPYIIDGSIAADSATKSLIDRLSSHQYIQEGDQAIDQNNNKLQNYLDDLLRDAALDAQSNQAENPITN